MFDTLIVQPIFNLLVLIYALIPGHNFGLAIILFTIAVRLLMWPIIRKQLHQTKALQALQPEMKRIKQATKGDRQKESMLLMELYKERQVNPFASLITVLLQAPIWIGLFIGLRKLVEHPQTLIDFSYPFVRNLSWMKELAGEISKFDGTLLGLVDLTRPALGKGAVYVPAMIIVLAASVAQYFQSKQLLPEAKEGRKLREILREAGQGKPADNAEVRNAVNSRMIFLIPFIMLFWFVGLPSGLALYFLVSGIVAIIQQGRILNDEESEMEAIADKAASKPVIEGEVVAKKTKPAKKKKTSKSGKRRR